MKKIKEFHEELQSVLEQRREYLESDVLIKTKDLFKTYHSAFNAVFMLLLKKALIKDDPYKHEYRITEITLPPTSQIPDSEKGVQLGIRLSYYNTQLDYINSYYTFSSKFITLERIKLLIDLLNYIDWDMVAEVSNNPATRVLAGFLNKIRQGTDQIAISVINTSLNQMSTTKKILISNLELIREYHNESYKLLVREKILMQGNIYKYASENSTADTISVFKKKFPEVLVEQPFIPNLISQILDEEFTADSEELKDELLSKLAPASAEAEKKEKPVTIKKPSLNILVNAALTVCSSSSQIRAVLAKIDSNFAILEEPTGSAFIKWLYKVLKLNKSKKRVFEIEYIDDLSGMKKAEKLDLSVLMRKYLKTLAELSGAKLKSEFSVLESTEKKEDYLLIFIAEQNKNLKSFIQQIQGIDKYLKQRAKEEKRNPGQLKGSLLEINVIKNCIIKSQQLSHEYMAEKEEYNQFKSLGITDKSVD